MAFDVNKHLLVPKHTKISDSEKSKLLEKYNVNLLSLPKILKDDPALSKFDVKVGDVVKIERKSKTAGASMYYRVVVEA
ncbi:DNA-directed RNA polymerase subunit H [Candidatus Woesearchaeota archaeon]|nr:DNA-directed RNA polymerase subunit H [Candidatus Woesearchaeota archaeon]